MRTYAPRGAFQTFLLLAAVGLAGCLSNPVIKDMPDLANVSIGAVTAKLAEDIKPGASTSDESESFRHWRHSFQYCRICYDRKLFDLRFFGAYQPACEARQGNFLFLPSREYPTHVECRTAGGQLHFAVYAKVESKTINSLGTSAMLWFVTADSFEPKDRSTKATVHDDYAERTDGFYKRDREQARIATQERTERAKNDAERRRQQEADLKRSLAEQQAREQPKVRTVGQKVCTTVAGNERQVVAVAFGKPVFGEAASRRFLVTGFTEQVAGDRIKILIGGIRMSDERGREQPVDKLDGDPVWERGKATWDDSPNWRLCQ